MSATSPSKVAVGDTFRSVIADGNPLFKITAIKNQTVTAAVVPEPIEIEGVVFPGEYGGMVKEFLLSDIERRIEAARRAEEYMQAERRQEEAFWADVSVGSILHQEHMRGMWVRIEVVSVEPLQVKSVALVGDWPVRDLPHRRADGQVYVPYCAQQVVEGAVRDAPRSSMTYEGRRSGERVAAGDPRDMPEVDLTVPGPTAAEAEEHARHALLRQIVEAAQASDLTTTKRLEKVAALLR